MNVCSFDGIRHAQDDLVLGIVSFDIRFLFHPYFKYFCCFI